MVLRWYQRRKVTNGDSSSIGRAQDCESCGCGFESRLSPCMIYVDSPTWMRVNGRKSYAHMVADSKQELHQFAALIGVKRHFYDGGKRPHYDITSEQHVVAIANGAVEVKSKEIVQYSLLMNKGNNDKKRSA